MTHPVCITKDQMREGLARRKTLTQEEWANPLEIQWVDELIAEGVATISAPWEYRDEFQCKRRRVTGAALSPPQQEGK